MHVLICWICSQYEFGWEWSITNKSRVLFCFEASSTRFLLLLYHVSSITIFRLREVLTYPLDEREWYSSTQNISLQSLALFLLALLTHSPFWGAINYENGTLLKLLFCLNIFVLSSQLSRVLFFFARLLHCAMMLFTAVVLLPRFTRL